MNLNTEKEERLDEQIRVVPYHKTLNIICYSIFGISLFMLILKNCFNGRNGIIAKTIFKILPSMANCIILFCICLIISIIMFIFLIKKPKFDDWIVDIADKELSSEYIGYFKDKLYINYDRTLNKKNIKDFVKEMSDKSDEYSYYFGKIYIKKGYFTVNVTKKHPIPEKASIDKEKDNAWNIIPLGDCVNHELKTVTPICWWLNDNIKRKDVLKTLPSTSLLISGGTGSGKSVLQQCILGHISRHADHFMFIGCDVKQVEFNNFIGVAGVRKIALNLEEVGEAIQQARDIMYDRFSFMKDNKQNNIYNVKTEVDYYEINGKKYQFDEIFQCKINGENKLLKMGDIYKEVEKGSDVELDDEYYNF